MILPKLADEYVHRIGRTGRAGNKGASLSFVGPKDWKSFCSIRHFLQQEIEFKTFENLVAKFKGNKNPRKPSSPKQKSAKTKPAKKVPNKQPKKRIDAMAGKEIGDVPIRRKHPTG